MSNPEIIGDITLLEAHANEALRIAARLRKKLQPVSTGRSKKKGLSTEAMARVIGKKRKNQFKKVTA